METAPADATYAEQITNIYNTVKSEHGDKIADKFSDWMRGASFIEGGDLVSRYIESLDSEEFKRYLLKAIDFGDTLRSHFGVQTTREAFEKLKERDMAKDYRYYWIKDVESDDLDKEEDVSSDGNTSDFQQVDDELDDGRLYSEGISEVFKRVESLFGKEKANGFNEFVRGASLLVEGNKGGVVRKVDKMSDADLNRTIEKFMAVGDKLKKQYDTETVYEAFEKILELGRTKIYLWEGDEYKEVIVEDEEKSIVPWTGVIRIGGPNQILNGGAFSVLGPLSIKSDGKSITINGHVFEKTRENDPNIRYIETPISKIEDEIREGKSWDGKWELAVDEKGEPLKSGPESKMYMRRISD